MESVWRTQPICNTNQIMRIKMYTKLFELSKKFKEKNENHVKEDIFKIELSPIRKIPVEWNNSPLRKNNVTSKIDDTFSSKTQFENIASNNFKKITRNESYTIDTINTVGELIKKLWHADIENSQLNISCDSFTSTDSSGDAKKKLRFLVTDDTIGYSLWFAAEGSGPAHYQMTGDSNSCAQCIAAGNIILTSDCKTLVYLNNKSGDFRPEFDTLRVVIWLLWLHRDKLPFSLPDSLTVGNSGIRGGISEFVLSQDEITTWVNKISFDKELVSKLKSQPIEKKVVTYEKPALKRKAEKELSSNHIKTKKIFVPSFDDSNDVESSDNTSNGCTNISFNF
jgi:hypothetical protein